MKMYDISRETLFAKLLCGTAQQEERCQKIINDVEGEGIHQIGTCCFLQSANLNDSNGVEKADACLVGPCTVVDMRNERTIDVGQLKNKIPFGTKRVLFKSESAGLTKAGAAWLIESGVQLVGTETSFVGHAGENLTVHHMLMRAGVISIRRLSMELVPDGEYFLAAHTDGVFGTDGAFCRAVLLKDDE